MIDPEPLQTRLSFTPWTDPRTDRLPGIVPFELADWIEVDSAYAGQMALRRDLLARDPGQVHALDPRAHAAAGRLLELVLAHLPQGYRVSGGVVRCPDGVEVTLEPEAPLITLGRICQADFCLLQRDPAGSGEHVLTGAVLCFPAGWSLGQKFLAPMMAIHRPVELYTPDLGRRVQRLLDGVPQGRGLMRGTASLGNRPLADPREEGVAPGPSTLPQVVRVERQGLVRVPEGTEPDSAAVVFSIHTQRVRPEHLSADQARILEGRGLRVPH